MSQQMCHIAVLASGHGSNFQALIESIHQSSVPATIDLLLTNKASAHALHRATDAGIPSTLIDNHRDPEQLAKAIRTHLSPDTIDLICLAGFMRILPSSLVQDFPRRIMNIHPSLLPMHPGLNAIPRALGAGDAETGVTVHYVDDGVDTGPIIRQERLRIEANDTVASLTARIHRIEHRIYPEVVRAFVEKWQPHA
jgi:phosphoribosylglycinamide formyltransferase 1